MEYTINRKIDFALKQLVNKGLIDQATHGLFLSKDCIVTHSMSEGKIKFTLFNYRTFENKPLGYRKTMMTEEEQHQLQNKVSELEFYNTTIPSDGVELIRFIFTEVFPHYGYCVRKEQVELSMDMYHTLIDQKISLCDIPVGLGKTHAYLVAAIVYNMNNKRKNFDRKQFAHNHFANTQHSNKQYSNTQHSSAPTSTPMVISTSSIQLQKAIEKEYIPCISNMLLENGILSEPITSVQRKGKENYVCDQRLTNYVNTLNRNRKPESELNALTKLTQGFHIDLTDISGITNYDKRRINVSLDRCNQCKNSQSCRYQRFMQDARSNRYTFQICNHNYYLADALRKKKGLKSLLPNHKAVIIDEAHKLVSAAEDMYGVVLNIKEIKELIQKAKPHNSNSAKGQSAFTSVKEAQRLVDTIVEVLNEQAVWSMEDAAGEKVTVRITSAFRTELNRLRLHLEKLSELQPNDKTSLISGLKRITTDIEMIIKSNMVSWITKTEGSSDLELHCVSKILSKQIYEDLFSKDLPFILTSGTLALKEDFTYFSRGLGLPIEHGKRIMHISKQSPFNYFQNTMIYEATNLPFPNAEDQSYIEAISFEISKLIKASHGHALVLFTSYQPMKQVYELLNNQSFGFPIFQLTKGKNEAFDKFRSSNNSVLLACGSAWEGIDFKGDRLSHLIIVKLPFLVPDPMTENQQSEFDNFEEFKQEVLIPKMLIRLKQGHGRAIRSETDTAVISILDSRVQGAYQQAVRSALPECPIVHDIEAIQQFFLDKKESSYFTQ